MRTSCIGRATPHPQTGEFREWVVEAQDAEIAWQSYAGPLRFDDTDFAIATRKLLSIEPAELPALVCEHVEFASADRSRPRLIVHSTTPFASSFETDLAAMVSGAPVADLTTYVETRALYLARGGDLAVGRTRPWRDAVTVNGVERLCLPDSDFYYLSQALVRRAVDGGDRDPVVRRIVEFLRATPTAVVCPYDFEPEFQLLVTWLAGITGLGRIQVDANNFRLSIWNGKRMLHPTVRAALELHREVSGRPAAAILDCEQRASPAFELLGFALPVVPGYTVTWQPDRGAFTRDMLRAAALLRQRYGLTHGCLKPSDGGNGGRITPGVELSDSGRWQMLADSAWLAGGDQVVEAHVTYFQREVGGESVLTTPSAHVRAGELLDGLTLQFMTGTSWKGNIFLDEKSWYGLGLAAEVYGSLRATMTELHRRLGLLHCGIDFAVGTVGGIFGESVLAAVQDINPKMTGAVFLREFMARHPEAGLGAVTRVLRPEATRSAARIHDVVDASAGAGRHCEVVGVVPGRWAMIAASAETAQDAAAHALSIDRALASSR